MFHDTTFYIVDFIIIYFCLCVSMFPYLNISSIKTWVFVSQNLDQWLHKEDIKKYLLNKYIFLGL